MSKRKLRVMFNSNAPWVPSGYGQQMKQILPRLVDMGVDVACICFYGLEGGKLEGVKGYEGITFFPKLMHAYGGDAMWQHQHPWKADCVISLQDQWTLMPQDLQKVKNWIPLIPVDHAPVPPGTLQRLPLAYRMISMSEFGDKQLKEAGYHSTYIPHSIEPNLLKIRDKTESRKRFSLPEDKFVFGMVSANKDNPPRKAFQQAMEAFKMFHDVNPDSILYFHLSQEAPTGFPIDLFAKTLGIQDAVFRTPQYVQMNEVTTEDLSYIYSAFDCLLSPSTNEGFGVPIIESQACGTPVIVNNWTSMPYLVKQGVTGEVCDIAYKRFDPLLAYVAYPDVKSLYKKMIAVSKYKDREETAKACRKHVLRKFSDDVVFDKYWKPFIRKLETELIKD